ncbi:MAG: hypothetical protein HC903_03795 [Methylacidiphilales bacterium]|nr:hypothetical protein [Candidatus Methylacidiphilales bacterium]NJR14293.1 hypothetical protein [Calothrix sp. CSU_2_0]
MRDKPTVRLCDDGARHLLYRDRRLQSTLVVLLVWGIVSLLQWFQMQ